jgi:hypothetical protein
MKTQKLISLCLILALLASLMCLPAAAAEVSDWDELSAALANGGEVKLSGDVTAPAERSSILEVPAGVTACLDLNGFTLDGGTPGEEDCVILVHGSFTLTDSSAGGAGRITGTRDAVDVIGGEFTLSGGTLDACGNDGVAVAEGGSFTMTGGVVRGSGQIGVYVIDKGSTATISGGEIGGSVGSYKDGWFYSGTGLEVDDGAAAEIAGGVISGNVFGVKSVNGSLVFSGGTIRDNTAVEFPGGEYGGAGIYVYHGTVNMTGGTISGNSYAGLYTDEGSVTDITGGTITGIGAAGICMLGGQLQFDGGTVSGSQSDGLWLLGGAATMTDGLITDCAWSGVSLNAGSFTLSGGAIRDCGFNGILLNGEDAVCVMSGGTISGSRGEMLPEEDWYNGGDGVMVAAGSFEMTGGEMFDNVGGIEVLGGSAMMRGGVIRDSHAGYSDGEGAYGGVGVGVYLGEFTMTGGALRDNACHVLLVNMNGSAAISGGEISGSGWSGIYLTGDAALTLQGAPAFARNDVDLGLEPGKTVTIGGPLTLAEPLTVFLRETYDGSVAEAPVTVGLPGNGSAADFVYGGQVYEIVTGADGEAKAAYIRRFSDVTGTEWYASAASYAAVYGLLDAHDGRFDGDQPLTTADLLMALWRFDGSPIVETDAPWPYSDVAVDTPLADAIRWIEANGAEPDVPGLAEPDKLVQRWNMLDLCLVLPGLNELYDDAEVSGELPFTDTGELSEDQADYALWLTQVGILRGLGDGTMGLEQIATRAQLATVLMRMYDLLG